jgi:hypothetical protein
MKPMVLVVAFFVTIGVLPASAQVEPRETGPGIPPLGGAAGAPAGGANPRVAAEAGVPVLPRASELKPPPSAVPNEPIEPYLLTKDVGPFMVLARVFRGPDAPAKALALVKELRSDFGLPAFILRTKDYPGKSLMRGTPPTVPSEVLVPDIKMPEKIRTFDEAAVLVGNEKTLADQEKLWRYVKTLKPKSLEGVTPWARHSGLRTALRTTNPYVPAQLLFAHPGDRLLIRINSGHRSIANCPGRYSLQIADFSGRASFQLDPDVRLAHFLPSLVDPPLGKAAEDAERMADKLSKDPEIQRLGQPIYVYHGRTASKVFIGSFNDPRDPAAAALRNQLVQNANAISNKDKTGKAATETMIVPALALTDLSELKATLKN